MPENRITESYQLSHLQQGMLFDSLYAEQPGVDIVQIVATLDESIDVSMFERAWHLTMERHPILRTAFCWENLAEPMQQVYLRVQLPFVYQDWRTMSGQSPHDQLEQYLEHDRKQGFNLAVPPLIRLALFRTAQTSYSFILTLHHAILDGRSFRIVLEEVFQVYDAWVQKQEPHLAQPRPYRDYITWLQQHDQSRHESFWREVFAGFTPPSAGEFERPATAERVVGHDTQEIELSPEITAAVQAFVEDHHLTMNTLVQACWALLLSYYTNQPDIVFGIIRSSRWGTVQGAESIAGLMINTLPIRIHVAPEMPVLDWLRQLRTQNLALREHLHTPLSLIRRWSNISQETTLFSSVVTFDTVSLNTALQAKGGTYQRRTFHLRRQPSYPLSVMVFAEPRLRISMIYERCSFKDDSIARMLQQFQTLLAALVAEPTRRVADLSPLPAAERTCLVKTWNATETDYPRATPLTTLFAAQVARHPSAAALRWDGGSLSYADLDQRVNQLAHYLRIQGVGPKLCVGLYLERSPELMIAMLAVLSAGAAYVPLDPRYPAERLHYIMTDTSMPVVLTSAALHDRLTLPSVSPPTVLTLEAHSTLIAQQPTAVLPVALTAEHLAYVMYTSGSTGQPKGVAVTHQNIVRLVQKSDYVTVGTEDRVLQAAPASFDAATFEIWGALLNGACLVLPPPHLLGLDDLVQFIAQHNITMLWLTAGLFHQLTSTQIQSLRSVRHLLTGGDVVSAAQVRSVLEGLPGVTITNGYGPTECTTFSTTYSLSDPAQACAPLPIGRPIANAQVYVLNSQLQLVPIGAPGELYIGGEGVAQGYYRRPGLTAERFIPDPFSSRPGTRLYRTGDIVRYRSDGTLDFLGRSDGQVKLRGFRIELDEIEVVLRQHPAIHDAVVVTQVAVGMDKRLVAYIVPYDTDGLKLASLRQFLQEKLPDYMIPAAFMLLDALPLTLNGKVDRQMLPPIDDVRSQLECAYVAPRTPIEATLVDIWMEELGINPHDDQPAIGVFDDFFELGGHSIHVMRVIFRVSDAWQVKLPLRSLFQAPTIAAFAKEIEQVQRSAPRTAKIVRVDRNRQLPST